MRNDIFHRKPDFLPDGLSYTLLFNEPDSICGGSVEITPELAMTLGHAAADISSRIAVGYSDHSICKLLANAFIAGAGSGGAQVTETDADFFAVAAFISRIFLFNLTVFFENDDGRLRIRMIDKYGLPIDRETQKRVETGTKNNNVSSAGVSDIPMPKSISGTKESFAAACSKDLLPEGFCISVSGKGSAAHILRNVLESSGCTIVRKRSGIISFSSSNDGTRLFICDEKDRCFDDGHILVLLASVYFRSGEKALAVPATAPSVIEQLASEHGGEILRIGRDTGAREIFLTQKILTDAPSSAVFLCSYLSRNAERVCDIFDSLPAFTLISREVSVNRDRRAVLSYLAETNDGLHKENTGALRICADGGWVSISPARSRSSLRVTGEGFSEEIASELCDLFIEKARLADKKGEK